MVSNFFGKKAVVVGGSGGIGLPLARLLKNSGADVHIIGRHEVSGFKSTVIDLDVPENMVDVINIVSIADILVLARGPFLQKPLHETSPQDWQQIVYANTLLPSILISSALNNQCESSWGRILVLGGTRTDTIQGFRTNAAYGAAKTALSSLVKSVALSYGYIGIRCNAVCPGFVDTEYIDFEQKKNLAKKNPDGKLISVEEIAAAGFFLLENPVFNGVLLPVDKGWVPSFI